MPQNDTYPARTGRINARCAGSGLAVLLGLATVASGCIQVPDQQEYAPLYTLLDDSESIVRLYCAPVPGYEDIATHPWFVVKRAGADHFDRWEIASFSDRYRYELAIRADGVYGNIYNNIAGPDEFFGRAGWVQAELRGPGAEPIIDFIQTQSPHYPCRNTYTLFPGPNSNTYAQWVLDQTGWDAQLPESAIGREMTPDCE